jgi:hypothetical protein
VRVRPFVRIAVAIAAYIPAAWAAGLLSLPAGTVVAFRPPNALLLGLALLDSPQR